MNQNSRFAHFGLGQEQAIDSVSVRWVGAGGVEAFDGVEPNGRVRLTQGSGRAEPIR